MIKDDLTARAGGLFYSVPGLTRGLLADGQDAQIFGTGQENTHSIRHRDGIQIHAAKRFRIPGLSIGPSLAQKVRFFDPDILHLHGLWRYPSLMVRSAGLRDVPRVMSPRGMLDGWALRESARKKALAMRAYERSNLERCGFIHALSEAELRSVRNLDLKVPVAVIPNGVELPAIEEQVERPEWLGSDTRKLLLFLGRIHPKKGLAETLRAWATATAERPQLRQDWALVLAGWDDANTLVGLKDLCQELGLSRDVYFPGPAFGDEKTNLLRNADAFILASHSEGVPMSVLEAWSHGLPVFKTRACNLPNGFAVGAAIEISTDPGEMAEVLGAGLLADELVQAGVAGRRLVQTKYSWERVAKEMAASYAWLLGGGAPPDPIEIAA